MHCRPRLQGLQGPFRAWPVFDRPFVHQARPPEGSWAALAVLNASLLQLMRLAPQSLMPVCRSSELDKLKLSAMPMQSTPEVLPNLMVHQIP